MRTLWEAIQDDDAEIDNKYEESSLIPTIASNLKDHFNKYLEPESNVRKVGQWYPLGRVDDDLYDKDNIKKTEDFIIKSIKAMHQGIKKTLKKTLIDVYISVDDFGETHIKTYTVELNITKHDKKVVVQFVLHSKRTMSGDDVEYIAIWTKSEELAKKI